MARAWPGFLPPVATAVGTLLVTWLYALVASNEGSTSSATGLLLVLLMPMPLVLAAAWGVLLLTARPLQLVILSAAAWLVVALALAPQLIVWQLGGNVAAGLAAGLVLGLRWRLDAALALVSAVLVPFLIWSAIQFPIAEQITAISDDLLAIQQESLPQDASDEQAVQAAAKARQALDRVAVTAERIYPGMLAIGLLGQSALVLGLVWLAGRRLGLTGLGRRLPPFTRWRLPFYVIWALIAGIGLVLVRAGPAAGVGLNLVLVAGLLVSIQGLAVQVFVTNRLLSPVMRLVFWVVMGVFFTLLMASSLVLGLADQWLDIRRLNQDGIERD